MLRNIENLCDKMEVVMIKRVSSCLLLGIMVFAMTFVSAFAEDGPTVVSDFAGLKKAVTETGGEIKLNGDIMLDETIKILEGKNVVLDLNGYSILAKQNDKGRSTYSIENKGNLTIDDTSSEKKGVIKSRGIDNYGSLNFKGGTSEATDGGASAGGAAVWNNKGSVFNMTGGTLKVSGSANEANNLAPVALVVEGKATVTGGKFDTKYTNISVENEGTAEISNVKLFTTEKNWVAITARGSKTARPRIVMHDVNIDAVNGGCIDSAGTVDVTNCEFRQRNFVDHNSMLFAVSNGGIVNVNGGDYISDSYGMYVFTTGGTINFNGGNIEAGKAVCKADESTTEHPPKIIIKRGTLDGKIEISPKASMSIKGGTFKNADNVKDYIDKDVALVEAEDGLVAKSNDDLLREIAELNKKLKEAKAEIERLTAAVVKAQEELKKAKDEVETLKGEVKKAQEELDRVNKEVELLKKEVKKANEELEKAKAEVENLTKEVEKAKEDAAAFEKELEKVTGEFEKAKEELQKSNEEVKVLNDKVEKTTKEFEDAKKEIETLKTEVTEAKKELEKANRKAEEAQLDADKANEAARAAGEEADKANAAAEEAQKKQKAAEAVADAAKVAEEKAETAKKEAEEKAVKAEQDKKAAEAEVEKANEAKKKAEADLAASLEQSAEEKKAAQAALEKAEQDKKAAEAEVENANKAKEKAEADAKKAKEDLVTAEAATKKAEEEAAEAKLEAQKEKAKAEKAQEEKETAQREEERANKAAEAASKAEEEARIDANNAKEKMEAAEAKVVKVEKEKEEAEVAAEEAKKKQKAAEVAKEKAETAKKAAEDAEKEAKLKADQAVAELAEKKEIIKEAEDAKQKIDQANEGEKRAKINLKSARIAKLKKQKGMMAIYNKYLKTNNLLKKLAKSLCVDRIKAKSKKRRVTISWSKIQGAEGYNVYYRKGGSKKFKLIKSVRKAKLITGKLKKGKYQFMIRPYVKIDRKIIEGRNSAVRKVKVK